MHVIKKTFKFRMAMNVAHVVDITKRRLAKNTLEASSLWKASWIRWPSRSRTFCTKDGITWFGCIVRWFRNTHTPLTSCNLSREYSTHTAGTWGMNHEHFTSHLFFWSRIYLFLCLLEGVEVGLGSEWSWSTPQVPVIYTVWIHMQFINQYTQFW